MVIISAAIITKQGKILLARQFLDITKSQLEGLLCNFPRLIDRDMQHTFVDAESVRYVYQSIDELYLILITTKSSNIVEDLETMRLLQKIIQHYCPFNVDEGNILRYSFDIVHAFDDVVSLGFRESVTLNQILTYTEMESQEERIAKEKRKMLELEAKEIAKRKQIEIDQINKEKVHVQAYNPPPEFQDDSPSVRQPAFVPPPVEEAKYTAAASTSAASSDRKRAPKRGLALGKNKKSNI